MSGKSTPEAATTVLVVGASGNIGVELCKQLRSRPGVTVLEASRSGKGGVSLDITDIASVLSLDKQLPSGVDHVVVCCGASTFGPLSGFDSGKWADNVTNKLLSVTRLIVMLANGTEVKALRLGGSITVTAGQAARTINKMWPGIATNNAGLEAFVKNSGLDMPRGIRCNAVSPALVRETAVKAGLPLANTVGAAECAAKYIELIFSAATASVVDAGAQVAFTKSHHGGQKDGVDAAVAPPAPSLPAPSPPTALATGVQHEDALDFRGQPSHYVRETDGGVVGLLAYDVCEHLTHAEYDRWLYEVHYHDLLANPHLNKIALRTVRADHPARLSSGAAVTNAIEFYRLAELHFDSFEAYDNYLQWFSKHAIPPPRTPAGKSAFKFYLLAEGETITRPRRMSVDRLAASVVAGVALLGAILLARRK